MGKDKKKEGSLAGIFAKYAVSLGVLIVLTTALLGGVLLLISTSSLIRPADDIERQIQGKKDQIAAVSDGLEVRNLLPKECSFAVFSLDGELIDANISETQARKLEQKCYNEKHVDLFKHCYEKIPYGKQKGIVVLKYNMAAQFSNKVMRTIFPSVDISLFVLYLIFLLLDIFFLSKWYQHKIRTQLAILKNTTVEIQEKNLDFSVQYTKISDINEIIELLDELKNQLSLSLKEQWKMTEDRKRQIGALAHDIKTPITIIRGNAELLEESDLTQEDVELNRMILGAADQVQNYVTQLITINKSENFGESPCKKQIELKPLVERMQEELETLCKTKKIQVTVCEAEDNLPKYLLADEEWTERVLLNVFSNAVDYCPSGKEILFTVQKTEEGISFITEDAGKGFSEEALHNATKEFYQEEESRNRKNHYGMGLYIAKTLMEKQGGHLHLSNSERLGGAKVTLIFSER